MRSRRSPNSATPAAPARSRHLVLLTVCTVLLAGIACWIYAPEEDPYAGLDRTKPHPREGGRLCLEGSESCVVHTPNLDSARHPEGPSFWREHLAHQPLAEVVSQIGKPDVEQTSPSGRIVRFWWSFCAADDQHGKWVVHLMTESSTALPAIVEKVRFVGGGAVVQDGSSPEQPPALPPPSLPGR